MLGDLFLTVLLALFGARECFVTFSASDAGYRYPLTERDAVDLGMGKRTRSRPDLSARLRFPLDHGVVGNLLKEESPTRSVELPLLSAACHTPEFVQKTTS